MPRLIKAMKKVLLLISLLIAGWWFLSGTNEYAAYFYTDKFYAPVFSQKINIGKTGSMLKTEFKPVYDVEHGCFLVFPCTFSESTSYAVDGKISYRLKKGELVLKAGTFPQKGNMISGYNEGKCSFMIFKFNLPHDAKDGMFVELKVESPMTELKQFANEVRCEIAPAYWP